MSGTLRVRAGVLVGSAVLAAAAAGLYSVATPDRYDATAELLVSPLPESDRTFAGFGLLRGDVADARATVAKLVRTPQVAAVVLLELGTRESREALLDNVSAHPGRGGLVAVVGHARSAEQAARIANAFATELVAQRTIRFRSEAFQTIARLRARLAQAKGRDAPALARRLAVVRGAAGAGDPTVQVAASAAPPSKRAWPRPWLLVPLGAAVGLVIGVAAALLGSRRRAPLPEDLAEREALLERRLKAVERAERELVRRAGELAAHRQVREPGPEPLPKLQPEPEPPPPVLERDGGWNLNDLQRVVETRGGEFPRAEVWAAYLFHLREHAAADGRLPASFDALVEDEFSELMQA